MCDLFGMSTNEPDRATRSLPIFQKHGVENPHGWGIAYYNGNRAIIKKKAESAATSTEFADLIQKAKSNVIISHVRFKTHGERCDENCHPFKQEFLGRDWIFAHNGMISGIEHGNRTDSEAIFGFMIDKIHTYISQSSVFPPSIYLGLKSAIKAVFAEFGRGITFNFLLSDGTILYAFNHYSTKPIYVLKREKDYGSAMLVSTQKLWEENVVKLRPDCLLIIEKGVPFLRSDPI
ncbi:MAG: class II glutamine amidotransferase [Candidatus Micrarchaeota archaeon]|nr:class II glutamine amidotransferase [Candidatus Micrarchaeota archaeon]